MFTNIFKMCPKTILYMLYLACSLFILIRRNFTFWDLLSFPFSLAFKSTHLQFTWPHNPGVLIATVY